MYQGYNIPVSGEAHCKYMLFMSTEVLCTSVPTYTVCLAFLLFATAFLSFVRLFCFSEISPNSLCIFLSFEKVRVYVIAIYSHPQNHENISISDA